jgi:hypothetical protein
VTVISCLWSESVMSSIAESVTSDCRVHFAQTHARRRTKKPDCRNQSFVMFASPFVQILLKIICTRTGVYTKTNASSSWPRAPCMGPARTGYVIVLKCERQLKLLTDLSAVYVQVAVRANCRQRLVVFHADHHLDVHCQFGRFPHR